MHNDLLLDVFKLKEKVEEVLSVAFNEKSKFSVSIPFFNGGIIVVNVFHPKREFEYLFSICILHDAGSISTAIKNKNTVLDHAVCSSDINYEIYLLGLLRNISKKY